ncbi:MAG: histidine phosphatase family protein [Myxococcota bacterium]
MSILLVRHGETAGNRDRVIQVPETPLSDRGLAQAARLGARLAGERVARVLASDLARARMTGEAIAAATGAPLSLDARLQERNFGDLRGTPYAELDFDPFQPGYVPPAGESWEDLHARADAVWEHLVELAAGLDAGDLVVVTHGLVCHSLVTRRLDLGPLAAPAGYGNTSLTVIDPRPPFRVSLVNCTAHLDAETAHDTRTRSGL